MQVDLVILKQDIKDRYFSLISFILTLDNPASVRVSMGFAVLLLLDKVAHGGKDSEISSCL